MKKSKRNYKKIIVITLAILLSLGGALYGVNTEQLTGFTGFSQKDLEPRFKPRETNINNQTSSSQNDQSSTPTRFEAKDSDFNKSKVKCNGVWQRGLEFVINYKQSQESLQLIHDKLHEFNKKGCQIAFQLRGEMPDRRTSIPYTDEFTSTFYCNGDLSTSPQTMECLIDDLSTQNGVSMMSFKKRFNTELGMNDEMMLIKTTNYTSDDFTHEQQNTEINQQKTPYIINILVK